MRELEWLWAVHPPAADRIEYYLARLLQLHTNLNRDTKQHADPFSLSEFRIDWEKEANERWRDTEATQREEREAAWGDDEDGPPPEEPLTDAEEAELLAALEAQHAAIYAQMMGYQQAVTPAQG
ncbi:MAG: hypothetical protein LC793_12275 [Thermomicrobia bacterium]|nr:hypothetical protein [Thermomicrobia bacterium]MCA1722654.1 hypothetical protein [Thermomicrobia bacterium]